MDSGRTVLVAGGAGFIGSNLCEQLLKQGCHVVCMDNLYSGVRENIDLLHEYSNFEFILHDINRPLPHIYSDIIFNLACPASPVFYQKNPIYTVKTNVLGAMNVLDLAEKNHSIVIQASTSEVYGDAEVSPQSEEYWGYVNPHGIRSCYDEGKRIAETLFLEYYRQYGTSIKIARIFNCFGPKMRADDGRVICSFINQALHNLPLSVNGDGNQTRSFCYVDDILQGLLKLVETRCDFTGPVNLGNPEEISIIKLASLIIELSKSNSKIEHCFLPEDDPKRRKPDIQLAEKELGWKPKISLQDGLLRTIYFYRNEKQSVVRHI